MRRLTSTCMGFDPDAAKAYPDEVRVRMSYLLGRWAQAPISHAATAREADT